ncbi:unnamed protein product [Sympodiomycopsis kandeliae]
MAGSLYNTGFSEQFHRLLDKRHANTDNCDWQPWMVGPACRPKSDVRKAASLHQDSYYFAVKHEKAATWMTLAVLALAILPGLFKRLRLARPQYGNKIASTRGYRTFAALFRGFGYWQPKGLFGAPLPSAGAIIVISVTFIMPFVYSLIIKPWYRPLSVWGSTPLGIRTGIIANAQMPFVYTLALKVNPITWLTGLSHERLQVYHQWLARISLLFGVIHSIAFCYQPIKEGGYHNLVAWWKFSPDVWNSGAFALAFMAWLVASSTRVFRNLSYEFFVAQHIISALAFLGVYFWHTADMIQSWSWLWPIVAVWGASAFLRIARAASASNFFMGTKTSIEVQRDSNIATALNLDNGKDFDAASKPSISIANGDVVRIALKTSVRWQPGQHVFIRFPTVAPTQSHPFTVVNLPNPDPTRESILVLLARVRNGVTKKLLQKAQWHIENGCCVSCPSNTTNTEAATLPLSCSSDAEKGCASAVKNPPSGCCLPESKLQTDAFNIPAIIDGPYGENASMASYDNVLLIAGGLGGTIALPILMDLAVRARRGQCSTKSVRLLLSFRRGDLQSWFEEYLIAIRALLEQGGVDFRVDIHCTSPDAMPHSHSTKEDDKESISGALHTSALNATSSSCCAAPRVKEDDLESSASPEKSHQLYNNPLPSLPRAQRNRANLSKEIYSTTRHAIEKNHKTMSVVVCGPSSMMDDTANTVAAIQWDILKGKMGSLREVFMLKEGFSW